jgi:branched-chain amino acid transport system substrate-binding protein
MLDDGGAFAAAYQKLAGSAPGPYTIHAYDAVKVWAAAAETAGSFGLDAVDQALSQIHTTGLTGPISFNADGSRSSDGQALFVIVKVSDDGTFKLADRLDS